MSKLGLWWDSSLQSRKCMSLKFTEELCFLTMNNDTKIEERMTCRFKIHMRNLTNFDSSTWKSKKLCFHGLLVTKIYNVWAKNVEELSFMTLKSDAKFEEKLTCGLKNDMRNLANFHQSTWKCQNWDFDGILLSKVENVWA